MTYEKKITLKLVKCGGCGSHFGLDEDFYDDHRESGKAFYCPNGCCRSYKKAIEDDRLRTANAALALQVSEAKEAEMKSSGSSKLPSFP